MVALSNGANHLGGTTWRWEVLLHTTSRPLTGKRLHDVKHCGPLDEVEFQLMDGPDMHLLADVTYVAEEWPCGGKVGPGMDAT